MARYRGRTCGGGFGANYMVDNLLANIAWKMFKNHIELEY